MTLGVPIIEGVIDRRVLVNFRIDPDRIRPMLPARLHPQLIDGHAIGGICLIRLKRIRPRGWPTWVTVGSENAAHRIAVEWDQGGQPRTGVYVPRRDTSSRLNTLVGGRLFPGVHHRADFDVDESSERVRVAMTSRDGAGSISVDGSVADTLPDGSVFDSVAQASAFFEQGSLGLSPKRDEGLEALELETRNWSVVPLGIHHVTSSFFGDPERFPEGTVEFDDALLMRNIDHRWHTRAPWRPRRSDDDGRAPVRE